MWWLKESECLSLLVETMLVSYFKLFFPRQHTLAFVPSSGLIYAFGCGARGQLGTGHTCNVKCPSPVKGYWAAHSGQLSARAGKSDFHWNLMVF